MKHLTVFILLCANEKSFCLQHFHIVVQRPQFDDYFAFRQLCFQQLLYIKWNVSLC